VASGTGPFHLRVPLGAVPDENLAQDFRSPEHLESRLRESAGFRTVHASPDGSETRLVQRLSGGRGAREEEHAHRQLGSEGLGFRFRSC
jgi:hypothetical protein